jgi:hypothetical protein
MSSNPIHQSPEVQGRPGDAGSNNPVAFNLSKVSDTFNTRSAMRGVPRARLAISCKPSLSIGTWSISAARARVG